MTPANILSQSRTFQRGYELCIGNGLPAENGKQNALIPGVVCMAFAIELAIKSLLLSDKNPSGGHKLNELFGKLNPAVRAEVIRQAGLSEQTFLHELQIAASAFVDWRYIYETPGLHSINLPFLESVWIPLAEIADRAARLAHINNSR